MSDGMPCGDGPDARYCPRFWELHAASERLEAEVTRLRGYVRELVENSGLDDDEQAEWLERAGIHDEDADDMTNSDVDPDACDAADRDDFEVPDEDSLPGENLTEADSWA